MPSDWQSDPSFPPIWAWERHYGYNAAVEAEAWTEHILKPNDFWKKLKPLPHARETLMFLDSLVKFGHAEVTFITSRSGNRVHWQTTDWLYQNGMSFPQVIIATDKVPVLRLLKPNFFIDDKSETIIDVAAAIGMEKWPTRLFVQHAPYNAALTIGERVSSPKEALERMGVWT